MGSSPNAGGYKFESTPRSILAIVIEGHQGQFHY
jgi:hypothetical protein